MTPEAPREDDRRRRVGPLVSRRDGAANLGLLSLASSPHVACLSSWLLCVFSFCFKCVHLFSCRFSSSFMYFPRLMFYLLWSLDNLSRSSVCLNKNKTASYVTRIDDTRFNCWNSIDVHFPENHTKKGEEIYKTISFITITKYSAKPPTPSPKNRR